MFANLQIMTNDGTRGDLILNSLKHKVSKQLFLMNGLPNSLVTCNYKKAESLTFDFLVVSRLDDWKRVPLALEAFNKFLRNVDLSGANIFPRLIIVGDGIDFNVVKSNVIKFGISDNVLLLGSLPHSSVIDLYQECSVFVSLYSHSNRANPVFEAMCHGLPIISVDDGSISDLIVPYFNGILCSENSLIADCSKHMQFYFKNMNTLNNDFYCRRSFNQKLFTTWTDRMNIEIGYISKELSND
jgi:glycosyltransferase involved in cell wall biosynthesis